MGSQITIISVMVTYITLLILWGIYQGRKVKTGADFAIAGRTLPGWAAALSERDLSICQNLNQHWERILKPLMMRRRQMRVLQTEIYTFRRLKLTAIENAASPRILAYKKTQKNSYKYLDVI